MHHGTNESTFKRLSHHFPAFAEGSDDDGPQQGAVDCQEGRVWAREINRDTASVDLRRGEEHSGGDLHNDDNNVIMRCGVWCVELGLRAFRGASVLIFERKYDVWMYDASLTLKSRVGEPKSWKTTDRMP